MPHPQLNNGKCSACGSSDLLLAEDSTCYSPVAWVAGKWTRVTTSAPELSEADEPVRLFCTACGVYHEVPEELK